MFTAMYLKLDIRVYIYVITVSTKTICRSFVFRSLLSVYKRTDEQQLQHAHNFTSRWCVWYWTPWFGRMRMIESRTIQFVSPSTTRLDMFI